MGDWNSTVPTFGAGSKARGSRFQTMADVETALTAAWTTWVPTLANLTVGSGAQIAKYRRLGKTVDFLWVFTLGAGSAVGTAPTVTLPVAPAADWLVGNTVFPAAQVYLIDSGANDYMGEARVVGSTMTLFSRPTTTGIANITSTAPFTWTSPDTLSVSGTYYTA